MKRIVFFCVITILFSCNDSQTVEDEFIEVNGEIKEKLIGKIEGRDIYGDKINIIFNYNSQNRISSITDGSQTTTFNYNSQGDLDSAVTIDYPGDTPSSFSISELYQAPYDVFDTGEVLDVNSKGNPIRVLVYDRGYGSESYIGELIYDDKPNPFFYTIKSSSMLNVLDRTELNFGVQMPDIIKAKELLPNNILTGMIFKNSQGVTVNEIQITYSYDQDNYPIQGDIFVYEEGESHNYYVNYFYK